MTEKRQTYTRDLMVMALCMIPMWALASERGSDEALKTICGVVLAAIYAIKSSRKP